MHGLFTMQRTLLPLISYLELPTFRTAGFMKWLVENFSVYQRLSKKELNVKQSSRKDLGRSDGIRWEEVLIFLSGEKHRTGFLDEKDVIRSELVQEDLREVLKQMEEEEDEIDAWMQVERIKAFMKSIGKSRPSSEGSSERPDFNCGEGSSSKQSRKSKRKRG